MIQPDFERARQYALERLERELPPTLVYHCVAHTRDDVVPAVERLAAMEGVTGEALLLLRTAAFYHDLGFVEQSLEHEAIGVRIAAEVLPRFGYSPAHIQVISGIIMVTRLPHTPHSLLEEIMADADLDLFGRDDFFDKNQALRAELAAGGISFTDTAWYADQLSFMRTHRYLTAAARALRDVKKQQNIAEMQTRLAQCRARECAALSRTALQGENAMLATTDKIPILRAVGLFAETPDDTLAELADLLRPLEARAGQTIFQKGEAGDCLYIIVSGRVRVHDGERTLNYLGPCEVFGEMALLDAEPRLASVTATEDTSLFRLDQAPFYELMASRSEVARGVIRVLCGHLRARVQDMAHDFQYMQQMARITAAATALEAGRYDPRSLDEVGQRTDALGQLARVFRRMANEVQAREQRLKQEVQQLRIQIDEAKKAREVAEITESEYFQQLQAKIKRMKKD